jgi:hypothetical protein
MSVVGEMGTVTAISDKRSSSMTKQRYPVAIIGSVVRSPA